MSIHTQGRSSSDLGRVLVLNDPTTWVGTVPEWKSCPRVVKKVSRTVGTAEASGRRLLAAADEHGAHLRRPAKDGVGAGLRAHDELHAKINSHKRLEPFVPGKVEEALDVWEAGAHTRSLFSSTRAVFVTED